jgi:hypothetical protein
MALFYRIFYVRDNTYKSTLSMVFYDVIIDVQRLSE